MLLIIIWSYIKVARIRRCSCNDEYGDAHVHVMSVSFFIECREDSDCPGYCTVCKADGSCEGIVLFII